MNQHEDPTGITTSTSILSNLYILLMQGVLYPYICRVCLSLVYDTSFSPHSNGISTTAEEHNYWLNKNVAPQALTTNYVNSLRHLQ